MKSELCDKEVLVMYDVRGIQGYIFKSNVAKEIIGASRLVEKIVIEGLQRRGCIICTFCNGRRTEIPGTLGRRLLV